ncbi:Dynein light chain [Spironucleus salmonicida]|uniref:Dynein light chain n=1 Tax=Spironucleus salmonicida TaxID=348837 RepID=V6LMW4_9EUKA|nr:Dynein light chain [Spironucleus salmonicida]|eukprot:EST46027.1 Dynein light chain [Spironucleus salmonicida]
MNQNELNQLQLIFDSHDSKKQNSVDMWQLRKILKEYGIELSDDDLFSLLIDSEIINDGQLTFNNLVQLIQQLKRRNFDSEMDSEIHFSWIALGGNQDKSGYIQVNQFQSAVMQLGLNINVELILIKQTEKKQQLQMEGKKLFVPTQLDFEEYKTVVTESRNEILM